MMPRGLAGIVMGVVLACGRTVVAAGAASTETPPEPGRQAFRAWLDRQHEGYECDEGPARFRNPTAEAAYPGKRLYYALTYVRGIRPPDQRALSLVAAVDSDGHVTPFSVASPQSYRMGLVRVTSSKDARRAAAAVLVLSFGDPGERRWAFKPNRIKAKRDSKGWKCTFQHDKYFASWVRFDRDGHLLEVGGSAPPVP